MNYRKPKRLEHIAPSQIRENMRIAREVGAINLAQGRPDFPTDARIMMAAIQAISNGHNQYSVSWGLGELREAVSASIEKRFGFASNPDRELTITCGVTEGMVAAMLALVEAGDEVIVMEPAHENYVPAIGFAGGTAKFVTLRPPDFALALDELEAVISPRTRVIILNTPHNPSGHVFARDEIRGVLELCAKHECYLITDEIYDRLLYPPHEHVMPAAAATRPDLVVTTGGLSKIYAATGWRLGYVMADPELTDAIRTVHDYLTICAPTPFQHAAVTALDLPPSYYDELRQKFLNRRDTLMNYLREAGMKPYEPQGAYYLMAEFEDWGFDEGAEKFTHLLIKDAGVATVPGTAFYYRDQELGNRLIRFSFAKSADIIEAVGEQLQAAFVRQTSRSDSVKARTSA